MKYIIQMPLKWAWKKIVKYYKKICAVNLRQVICAMLAAMLAASAITGVDAIINSHYRLIKISLNYDGAQHGLTPSKGRFDINKIKSDEVIAAAIEKSGDKSLTVENVRPRITIESNMPRSSVDKTISEISNGEKYSYTPAEFVIYYSQKKKLGKNYTVEFLNALAQSYRDFFVETYSDKNTVLAFDDTKNYENKDYDEICSILSDKVNSMINYLGQKQEKGLDFISNDTGYKYSDLVMSLSNIRDINIEKLDAYIKQNHVSRDKNMFLNKKSYIIDSETRNFDYLNGASVISNTALKIYDARISGVAFVPTVDDNNEFYMSRTKTGIDNLSKMSYRDGKKAAEVKKKIDEYRAQYDRFEKAPAATQQLCKNAEDMISDIKTSIKAVSETAVRTDNEYIAKKNNNYLSITTVKRYRFPVKAWIKYTLLFSVVLIAAIRLWQIAEGVVLRFVNKEIVKNESEDV